MQHNHVEKILVLMKDLLNESQNNEVYVKAISKARFTSDWDKIMHKILQYYSYNLRYNYSTLILSERKKEFF